MLDRISELSSKVNPFCSLIDTMSTQKLFSALFLQLILAIFVLDVADAQYLKLGFYKNTCPAAEDIVRETTAQYISKAPTLAASLLRIHFHDCFVRVCMLHVNCYSCTKYHDLIFVSMVCKFKD